MGGPFPARFLTSLMLLLFLEDLISLDIPLTEISKSPDLAPSAECSYKVKRSFSWSILNGIRKLGSRSAAEPVRCEAAHYDSVRPMMKRLRETNGQFSAKLWIADSQSLSWGCGGDDSVDIVDVDAKKTSDESIAAMVPRGGCSFAEKAMVAQLKGFTALLIENSVGGPPIPPDVSSNPLVTIPVVMISKEVGHALRSEYSAHRAITFNVTLMLAGTNIHKHSESSAPLEPSSAQHLRVVTAIPRGASVTVVQPVVQAVTEAQPFAELVIFTEHDPYHARSIVQLGARITLARLPGKAELPACTLSGALHGDCALALMELTSSPAASLWIHPSFDASRVSDLLHAFASLSNQIAASGDDDSTLALASPSSEPLEFDGVPLASEGMHWQCNGALAFWQPRKVDETNTTSILYRFVLPWNLCTVQCEDDDAELRRGRARFDDAPSNPSGQDTAVCSEVDESSHNSTSTSTAIDVVIPAHSKDAVTLQRTVAGARRNVVGVRRVIVVSRTRLSDDAEFVAEDAFESYFSLERVEEVLGRIGIFHNNTRTPFGWYFQQLIKFYAPLIIPDIAANVLVLDSDTVFLRPARFFEPDSSFEAREMTLPTIFTVTGDESGPQMLHMGRLLPGLVRQHESMSAIAHHMLLNRGVLEMMFAESEEAHGRDGNMVPFHDLFLLEIDSDAEHKKSASEYEIYFNYFYAKFPNQTRVRHAAWCNGLGLAMTQMGSSAVYDFVSFHDTFQKKGCAAFCCCEHHENEARRIDSDNDGA